MEAQAVNKLAVSGQQKWLMIPVLNRLWGVGRVRLSYFVSGLLRLWNGHRYQTQMGSFLSTDIFILSNGPCHTEAPML